MMLQYIPVIVTTKEALNLSVSEKMCVIYVGNELYLCEKKEIDQSMTLWGYQKARKQGCKGTFFVRSSEENGFDEKTCEIYDPFAIL